jgi:hypothetical protein
MISPMISDRRISATLNHGICKGLGVEKHGNGTKTASTDWGKPMKKPPLRGTPSVLRSEKREEINIQD